jgi:hypothetical protein
LVTPGFGSLAPLAGQVSQTHAAHGLRIDRLSGITRINALFVCETRP